MKYLIIGGVAGGATVAARLRRRDEQATIVLFERGKYVSYANCGLPYYVGGVIAERDKLFVQTVQGFTERFRVDIRTEQEVTAIDRAARRVTVRRMATGETYEETYDKLVLSPGAEPLRPRIPGIGHPRILTLRNVPDTDALRSLVTGGDVRCAVVVGGGFIGLEMAENLRHAGVAVDLVEAADQVMGPLDYSMAALVHRELAAHGVALHLKNGVASFTDEGGRVAVHLNDRTGLLADLVVLSIGVRPETKLAREAGLETGTTGGIRVDEFMQTSDENIYALGDAVEVRHRVTGRPALIPLAGPANKQGRIVADNLVDGNRHRYAGSLGTSVAQVFGLTVATAGANAKLLRREGIAYRSSWTHGSSHAGYYPGAAPLSVKILFAPEDGRLLGAQVVGYDGVDKRIEMLAQTLQRGGTVYDLAELEHAYAPPYSAAKDPVNMAGFVAENVLSGRVSTVTWRDGILCDEEAVRLDVRTPDEFALGAIPGFRNLPLDSLREHLDELPRDRPVVVTCAVGLRGYLAARILVQRGFKEVYNLSGGYRTWHAATEPVPAPAASCASPAAPAAARAGRRPSRTTTASASPATSPTFSAGNGSRYARPPYDSSSPRSSQYARQEPRRASKSSAMTCQRISRSTSPYAWARRFLTPDAPLVSKPYWRATSSLTRPASSATRRTRLMMPSAMRSSSVVAGFMKRSQEKPSSLIWFCVCVTTSKISWMRPRSLGFAVIDQLLVSFDCLPESGVFDQVSGNYVGRSPGLLLDLL